MFLVYGHLPRISSYVISLSLSQPHPFRKIHSATRFPGHTQPLLMLGLIPPIPWDSIPRAHLSRVTVGDPPRIRYGGPPWGKFWQTSYVGEAKLWWVFLRIPARRAVPSLGFSWVDNEAIAMLSWFEHWRNGACLSPSPSSPSDRKLRTSRPFVWYG